MFAFDELGRGPVSVVCYHTKIKKFELPYFIEPAWYISYNVTTYFNIKKVQVGNDQKKVQSERNYHSKNR